MTESNIHVPPQPGQIEVSLFGPGYGECLLLHLGSGDWVVVDSCIEPHSRIPIALKYFDQISVDPSTAVRFIIASHWHDDHIRGISDVWERCGEAVLACPAVVRKKEFMTLAIASGIRPMMESSGVAEFARILAIAKERNASSPARLRPFRGLAWASHNQDLLLDGPTARCPVQRQIRALSPSDMAISASLAEIASLLPSAGETRRRVVQNRPNHAAVVIFVKVGDTEMLLGADIENTKDPDTGWHAILDSRARPAIAASAYKISHHGSSKSDNDRVWGELLSPQPHALVTPYMLGGNSLPTRLDVERICRRTGNAYITAMPRLKVPRFDRTVERTVRETVRSIREVLGPFGHIRLRRRIDAPVGSEWDVELFEDAMPLSSLRGA